MAIALPAALRNASPAATGLTCPLPLLTKANNQAQRNRGMVPSLKPPVQNLTSMSLNADISVEGYVVQSVGPDLLLLGELSIAENRALPEVIPVTS